MIHQRMALAARTVGSFYSILVTGIMALYLIREVLKEEHKRWRSKQSN